MQRSSAVDRALRHHIRRVGKRQWQQRRSRRCGKHLRVRGRLKKLAIVQREDLFALERRHRNAPMRVGDLRLGQQPVHLNGQRRPFARVQTMMRCLRR
jgi:hypothetical protein